MRFPCWRILLLLWCCSWANVWGGVEFPTFGLGQKPADYFGLPNFSEQYEQMLFHHNNFFSLYYFRPLSHSPAYLLLQNAHLESGAVYILRSSPGVIAEIYFLPDDPAKAAQAKMRLQQDHGIVLPHPRVLGKLRNKFLRVTYPHIRPHSNPGKSPSDLLVMATAKSSLRCKLGGFFTQLGPQDAAITFYDPALKICSMAVVKNSDTMDVIEEILEVMRQEFQQEGGNLFTPHQGHQPWRGDVTFYLGDKFNPQHLHQIEHYLLAQLPPAWQKKWFPQIVHLPTKSENEPTNFLFSIFNGAYFSASCDHWLKP